MSTNILYDFIDAGYRVFGLHGGNKEGSCKCGRPECEAAFKHPITSNWTHTPEWSDESLEGFQEMGTFDTGYGVLVYAAEKEENLLIVDVDARNGGVAAFAQLCKDCGVDLVQSSGLTVLTGSGQGSMHVYFKAPKGVSLVQNHKKYSGNDFKSSGFVVGPGSLHKSGNTYEILNGSPDKIGPAPASLIEIIKRPESFRATYDGAAMDVTQNDLAGMLHHIDYNCDRSTWISVAMALHHTTMGSGFDLWDAWSQPGDTYPGRQKLANQWDRFGKSGNPVTLGTLVHLAKEGGWSNEVEMAPHGFTFDENSPGLEVVDEKAPPEIAAKPMLHPFHIDGVDLLRPPGFVGEVTKWINDCSRAPRENLAVGAALVAVSNVIGLKYTDDHDGVTANLFAMCVAGSATGKEAVMEAVNAVHMAAGIQRATVGAIKSEQEIIRNLIDNQAAFYVIDELGIVLKNITTSKESYHAGVIGTMMSAYSKAKSYMPLNGDAKRDVRKTLQNELKAARTAVSENEDQDGFLAARIPNLERAIRQIDNGLEKPYLSMIGFTTPVTFDSLVTPEQATNGFIGRSIIINEPETNPKSKIGFKAKPMSTSLDFGIKGLYHNMTYENGATTRVEWYGERDVVRSTQEAKDMLDQVAQWAWEKAESHKERTGLESIPRRAREMVSKISLILAAPSGLRTAEHVRWAYKFIERDIRYKCSLAYANELGEHGDAADAIRAKIKTLLDDGHGETGGVLVNRCKKWSKDVVKKVIEDLVKGEHLIAREDTNPTNKRTVTRYFLK